MVGSTGKHWGLAGGSVGGELWTRAFTMVFAGRNTKGRVSRFTIG